MNTPQEGLVDSPVEDRIEAWAAGVEFAFRNLPRPSLVLQQSTAGFDLGLWDEVEA